MGICSSLINTDHRLLEGGGWSQSSLYLCVPHPGTHKFSMKTYYVPGPVPSALFITLCLTLMKILCGVNPSSILPLHIWGSERLRNLFKVTVKKWRRIKTQVYWLHQPWSLTALSVCLPEYSIGKFWKIINSNPLVLHLKKGGSLIYSRSPSYCACRNRTKTWYTASISRLTFQEEMKPYSIAIKIYSSVFYQFDPGFWALSLLYKCNLLGHPSKFWGRKGTPIPPETACHVISPAFSWLQTRRRTRDASHLLDGKAPSQALGGKVLCLVLLGCIIQWSRALSTRWEPKRQRGNCQHFECPSEPKGIMNL